MELIYKGGSPSAFQVGVTSFLLKHATCHHSHKDHVLNLTWNLFLQEARAKLGARQDNCDWRVLPSLLRLGQAEVNVSIAHLASYGFMPNLKEI